VLAFLACVALLVGAKPAPAAVVAHWRMDEASGQVVRDASGGGLDAVLGTSSGPDGADPARIPGRWGGALSFDGSDRVTIPDRPVLEPARISVEAWVRRAGSPGQYRYVLSKGGATCFASSYGLYSGAGGGLAFYVSDATRFVPSPAVAPAGIWDGRWHHAVGTFDGAHVRLYVDGAQVGAGIPVDLEIKYGLQSTMPLIGSYLGSCELPFSGDIDEVRVWNEALAPGQVAGYAAGGPDAVGPPLPPPAAVAPDPAAPGGVFLLPAGQAPGAPLSPVALKVTGVAVSPTDWRLPARRRRPAAATIRFNVSARSTATLTFSRAVTGRRVGRRCVAPTRRNLQMPRCARFQSVGSITVAARAGRNAVRFQGRIKGRLLPPGRYEVRVRLRDASGRTVASPGVPFRAVAP
jgi:Concanavalin A-like lectin/glucanases superfamily